MKHIIKDKNHHSVEWDLSVNVVGNLILKGNDKPVIMISTAGQIVILGSARLMGLQLIKDLSKEQ